MYVYWQVSLNGNISEPLTTAEMQALLNSGVITAQHRIWSSHEPTWQPAEKILTKNLSEYLGFDDDSLAEAPPPVVENSTIEKLWHPPSGSEIESPPTGNFFINHWRGKFSLPLSYWVVGFALSAFFVLIGKAVESGFSGVQPNQYVIGLTIIFLTLLGIFGFIWYIVGVWRSAGNAQRIKGTKFWPAVARVMVIISVVAFCAEFTRISLPILREGIQLAVGKDDILPAQIKISGNGKIVTLSGGMPFGTSEKLVNILDAAPEVRIINFKSIGGRIGEGFAIYNVMKKRGLESYSDGQCISACTIAFLGGKHRILYEKAKLGFHSGSFAGLDKKEFPEINNDVVKFYNSNNLPQWFITNATSPEGNSVWYPTIKQLMEAQYIHQTTNYSQSETEHHLRRKASAEKILLDVPVYQALKKYHVDTYNGILNRFIKAKNSKHDLNKMVIWGQTKVAEIIIKKTANAPDTIFPLTAAHNVRLFEHFRSEKPAICYNIWHGIPIGKDAKLYSDSLKKNEMELQSQLLALPPGPQHKGLTEQEFLGTAQLVLESINKNWPKVDTEVLLDPEKAKTKPKELCIAAAAFYRESLSALKPEWSARFHRQLARSKL